MDRVSCNKGLYEYVCIGTNGKIDRLKKWNSRIVE